MKTALLIILIVAVAFALAAFFWPKGGGER